MTDTVETSSALLPRREVIYCGACGMPPEYCEYGPDFESHCLSWLQKHHPELSQQLHGEIKAKKPPRPAEPWTTEERLTAFYEKYAPEKLDSVPEFVVKYAGKEDKLFQALEKKYGPEPEDPYYADSDDDENDEEGDAQPAAGRNKRRGAHAKKSEVQDIRVVIQKVSQRKRRHVTIVTGMETVPGVKLKDVSKIFSKKFAGSSSVKDKSIIVQGDHVYEAAEVLMDKFNVPEASVFLDLDGEIVPLK